MRKRHGETDEASIDMTPMLDVVFIMLIFFIVTTSFVKESGVEINRPTASTATSKKKANIFIAIKDSGDIYMEKRLIDVAAVQANIERLRAENPEGTVVVQADKDSKTGILVKVVDAAKAAGVDKVSVAASVE